MRISIETPVFKGLRLQRCIDSVLAQSSPHWNLSLLWDGGDEESRRILEQLDGRGLPNVTVHFAENRGIARARRFLTEHSSGEYILPLDDDDALPFHAVETLLQAAERMPWASVIRARRDIIDLEGRVLDTPPWFPFEPRHYQDGMVIDVYNHSQPYLIRRSAYDRTSGWEGFEDFGYAGEDCDIYLKLEETGPIELLDEVLYYYRVHDERASLVLTDAAAFEMWRRLADKTIARIGLPLRRTNERQPFVYERSARPELTVEDVDFVVVRSGGSSTEGAADSLGRAGVQPGALHLVDRGVGEVAAGLASTSRPVVCLLDEAVQLPDLGPIEALLHAMAAGDADLCAPRLRAADGAPMFRCPGFSEEGLPVNGAYPEEAPGSSADAVEAPWLPAALLMVRREVRKAVGGLDEGYGALQLAATDLCLRARQRGFRCCHLPGLTLETRVDFEPVADERDARRFRRKWAFYPTLVETAAPASAHL